MSFLVIELPYGALAAPGKQKRPDLIRRHEREIWTLTLEVPAEGGAAALVVFETTDDHPWRTVDGRWVETQALKAGMQIERADGEPARIVSVTRTGRTATVARITDVGAPNGILLFRYHDDVRDCSSKDSALNA